MNKWWTGVESALVVRWWISDLGSSNSTVANCSSEGQERWYVTLNLLYWLFFLHCTVECNAPQCYVQQAIIAHASGMQCPRLYEQLAMHVPCFLLQTPKCRLSELSFSVGSTLIDSSCQHLTAITVGPHGVRSTGTGACIPHGVGNVQQSKFITLPVNCMYYNCILYIRIYYKQSLQKLNDVTILLVPIFVWYYRFVSKKCNQNKPVDQNCF